MARYIAPWNIRNLCVLVAKLSKLSLARPCVMAKLRIWKRLAGEGVLATSELLALEATDAGTGLWVGAWGGSTCRHGVAAQTNLHVSPFDD